MKITPRYIRQLYHDSPPYQAGKIAENFKTQKVIWDLEFYSVRDEGNGTLSIGLYSPPEEGFILSVQVRCEILEKDFPLVKVLPKDTLVRLIGEIDEVDALMITIKNAQLNVIKNDEGQIYFPQGSRDAILGFLQSKIVGAANIDIYDPYPSQEILNLLEHSASNARIRLLGKDIDENFQRKLEGFNLYFDRSVKIKKIDSSHARFYIIDGEAFHIDPSFRRYGGDKATMTHKIDNKEEIIKDFNKWWVEATAI